MIRSLPLTALSLLLGFFFIFVGLIKISPSVNSDIYEDMKQEFGRYNKVFPLYSITGWRPYAKNFRLAVGWTEIACGAILVLIPGPAKELASIVLLGLMSGGFYTHYALKDAFERLAPSLVFGLLLVCRLIIYYQVSTKEKREEELYRKIYEDAAESEKNLDKEHVSEEEEGYLEKNVEKEEKKIK